MDRKIIVKKRSIPKQMHVFNFYGDLRDGYFRFPDGAFACSAMSLSSRHDIVWMLIPKQLKSGRLIAWPNFRNAAGKLSRLQYMEYSR